jgi:hypothetical protein
MNINWKLCTAGVVVALLSGCASMSSEECLATDWSAVGYEDGARGYTSERFGTHRKACAKHGVTADFGAYQSGREQGLVEYCQPSRGFMVGVNGSRYQGVCRIDLEDEFIEAYNAGYHLYTLRSNVNRVTSQINSKENELKRITEEIRNMEAALIDEETSTEDRVLLLRDLKLASERSGTLEAEIRDLYEVRARHKVELENYQVAVADLGY